MVRRSGIDHLDAYQRNLDHALQVLDRARVEHSLIPTIEAGRPRLAVPRSALPDLLTALAAAGRHLPLYAVVETATGHHRWTDLALRARSWPVIDLAAITVFVRYRDTASGQRFGGGHGPRIEIWSEDGAGGLIAPRPNSREIMVDEDARRRPVPYTVHGRDVPTYPPLATRGPFEVDFPIDMVYLWVDGSDPAWRQRRKERLAALGRDAIGGTDPSLFDQGDELRFSLRSVARFAPWVRRIYLVTDGQLPLWLRTEGTDLVHVAHRDILPDDALPTFNSHAITAAVHRIAGLADHFLVMNDDVLLGRPVAPERFFHSNGATRFFLSTTAIPTEAQRPDERPLVEARKRTRDLIARETGLRPRQVFRHTPIPLSRAFMEELEKRYPEWSDTMHSPFRAGTDIVPEWLHHYLGYAERRAFPGSIAYRYFAIGSFAAMDRLRRLAARTRPDVLCVNDVLVDLEGERHDQLRHALELYYPHPSPYETS